MRRSLATAVLAILAALVWAPLTVSAASPSLPDPLATAEPSVPPVSSPPGSAEPTVPASQREGGNADPKPGAGATAAAAAPTTTPQTGTLPAAAQSTPSAAPHATTGASLGSPPPRTPDPVPAIPVVAHVSPRPTDAAQATPEASPDAGAAPARAGPLSADQSRTTVLTLIGVGLMAVLGIVFMLLGSRRGGGEAPSAEATLAARAARRSRVRPADDPILRAMGLGTEPAHRTSARARAPVRARNEEPPDDD